MGCSIRRDRNAYRTHLRGVQHVHAIGRWVREGNARGDPVMHLARVQLAWSLSAARVLLAERRPKAQLMEQHYRPDPWISGLSLVTVVSYGPSMCMHIDMARTRNPPSLYFVD